MKTIMLYTSRHHNNTEKIAISMAESLNADILNVSEANTKTVNDYDIIGFGSGIYFKKHHKSLFSFVESLPVMKNKKAFIFSTSGTGKNEFNKPLELALEGRGFSVLDTFACAGFDTWGPYKAIGGISKGKPDEEDLKNASAFAKNLLLKRSQEYGINN